MAGLAAALAFGTHGYTASVTNPWFPLPPGRVWVSTGVKDGERRQPALLVLPHQAFEGVSYPSGGLRHPESQRSRSSGG